MVRVKLSSPTPGLWRLQLRSQRTPRWKQFSKLHTLSEGRRLLSGTYVAAGSTAGNGAGVLNAQPGNDPNEQRFRDLCNASDISRFHGGYLPCALGSSDGN